MRAFLVFLGFCASALIGPAILRAEDTVNAPVYVVTYFEAGAPAVSQTAALSRQFADASRKQPGNLNFEAFQEIGRPSRFAVLETWRDKAAFEAHQAAADTGGPVRGKGVRRAFRRCAERARRRPGGLRADPCRCLPGA